MSGRLSFSCCYLFLLIVVSLFHLYPSNKSFDVLCMGSEREALLHFKRGLVDEAGRLASWDSGEESDCCKWVGIGCGNITGHVHRIHLQALNGHCNDGSASEQRLRGDLSSSLLRLQQLKHLDLSCNDFGAIQVPKFIGSLTNLRYLNLSRSNFGGIIPPQLGNLSELQVLGLGSFHSHFETTSMVNMHWLSSLRWLQHLDLSGVDLSKSINWLQVINSLPYLARLHLSSCQLSSIHSDVARLNLTSLSVLDLSSNYFNSYVAPWIFSIASIVSLDLSSCDFHGLIPHSMYNFRNLTSLMFLYISQNDFMNASLVLRDLSSDGSNLISLDISSCGISSSALDSLQNLTSLVSLDLSRNQLTKRIPKALGYNLCNLRDLDFSYNDFSNISLTDLLESVLKCKSPHLESLKLSFAEISGTIPDFIERLSFLKSLDFGENLIFGPIPYSIGGLSSLEMLYLSGNQLNDSLPDSIGRLSSLEVLDLSFNRFSGTISDSIEHLTFLKSLHLGKNFISGPIPFSIGQLSSLKILHLFDNHLNGSLPYTIGQLSSLESLDLSHNQLNGDLPYSIGGWSSLNDLDLSNNQFNGSLPDSLGQLSKLRELRFSSNLLRGVVTEAHFSKLVSLKYLYGEKNNLTLRLQNANWVPPFLLQELNLNSWVLGPKFPLWLQSQKDLEVLDISNTGISSHMPPESFWRSLTFPGLINMSHNHIHGTLTLLGITPSLRLLDLSSNKLNGKLPSISNFPILEFLDLSNNLFDGSLENLLCSNAVRETYVLNLGNNHLSGVIPECWDKCPYLKYIKLENNNFSGGIPTTLGSLLDLHSLNMRGNKLSGSIPVSLMNLNDLEILQLGKNKLVGSIPSWFGSQLSRLRILNLRSNNFDGNIPHKLCLLKDIQILDLAYNNLSGYIPKCFNNFSVLMGNKTLSKVIDFISTRNIIVSDSLVTKGREDTYSTILELVTLLDLSCNNLVGPVPSEITSLKALQSLNLSRNQLIGRIPEKIGDMKALISFDLSVNMMYGELPMSLSNLNFLSTFNVSYNNFTGSVPSRGQLQTFNQYSFFGNKLCEPPVTEHCVSVEVRKKTHSNHQEEDGTDWGLIVSSVLGVVCGFWIVLAPLIVSRAWRIAYFGFLNKLKYIVYDRLHKYCFNMFLKFM